MQELQQQEQDITGAHSVRGQVALPGTSRDEYCNKTIHEESQRCAVMKRADSVSRRFRELDRGPGSFSATYGIRLQHSGLGTQPPLFLF
jgi:hypothetical protein